jgi:hypothetical protein
MGQAIAVQERARREQPPTYCGLFARLMRELNIASSIYGRCRGQDIELVEREGTPATTAAGGQ